MADKLACEYWLDPMCIWAFVGRDKLDRVRADYGDQLDLRLRVIPIFGSFPHRFSQGAWADGGIAGRVAATARVAQANGHPEVTGAVWQLDTPSSSWSPGVAIKAVQALERSDTVAPGMAERYIRALQDRFFMANENIARRRVQLAVATELGMDTTALGARLDDGAALADLYEDFLEKGRLSLRGSPSFVFDEGRTTLYGNFAYGVLRESIVQLLAGGDTGATAC